MKYLVEITTDEMVPWSLKTSMQAEIQKLLKSKFKFKNVPYVWVREVDAPSQALLDFGHHLEQQIYDQIEDRIRDE